MSELIQSWLNDEVQLSRRVVNFEKDFKNGYLLGELLSKYNQELNFHLFQDRDLRNDMINNYRLLEITLKTLRINFNAQIAHAIIEQDKGEALNLLYQLKSALEKVHNPADIKVLDDTGRLNTIVPLKQIKPVREIYDKMESDLFSKRLNQLLKAQKEIDLDQKLSPFRQTKIVNEYRARQQVEEDREKELRIQEEKRKMQINNLIRNKTFMEDWKAKGEAEWGKNMQIQKDREQRDHAFKLMTTMKEQQKSLSAQKKEREDVLQGIEAFEANAGKLGIDLKHDPNQTKKAERSTFSGTGALNKLMEATLQSETVRKERDKRRRKMIVDQARDQKDVELKKREMILLDKLQQQSKQENEIAYEVWRALQSKQVIIENRALRNDTYEGKKAEQQLIAQTKEDNLLKQIVQEKDRDFNQKMFRQRGLNVQQLSEKRLVDYKACSKFFDYIFEIADLCFQHQQDNDTLDIDSRFWRDCCNLFVEEKPLIPKKSFRHPDATEHITKTPTNDLVASTSELSLAELNDYLNGLGAWKPQHKFDPPKDVEDTQYIPNKPINNFNLGLIISNIIDMSNSQRAPLVVPADIPNYLPLRLVSLGYSFSGRKTLCDFLKRKYDINVLDMNDILKEAVDMSNKAIEEEPDRADEDDLEENVQIASRKELDEFSQIGRKIRKCLVQGQNIPDELYIEAILFKIKQLYPALTKDQFLDHVSRLKTKAEAQIQDSKRNADSDDEETEVAEKPSIYQQLNYSEGWILTGFPNNYEQLKALEKALSGFIPSDEQEVSQAEEKKKRAELIVKAPPKTIIPKKLIRGGIDAAIVLDVTKEECLRRALGRRIDPKTGIVYHLDDNPPPIDNAPLMERLVPIKDPENSESNLIDKLTRYDRVKEDMEKWNRIFGIEEMQFSCLQKFEGMGSEEEIHKRVQEYLDKLLSFKRTEYERSFIEVDEAAKRQQEEQELLKQMQEEEAKMVTTEQHIIREDLEILREKRIANLTIPPELLKAMTSLWEVLQETYISETTDVFTVIKEQRNFITVRIGELQRRFLELIKKEDDRLLIVLDFQKSYNKFLDENTDMIEEDDTKEELHQRVEDLYQQIWEVIENKKENLIEERKAIMSSGYIEDEMELLTANIQKLMQAELDRYFGCVQIIQDYYCTLEGKDIPEQPENMILDILPKAEITLPPIEDPEGPEPYPRIDLFYKNALKVLNGEELEEPAAKDAKKPGAKAPAKKEEPKKPAGKKDNKDVPQEEEKKELTPLENEMKETINLEKAILRYRLFLIKSLGTGRIREMREKGKTLYSKLEDWLNYGIKAENDAVSELTGLLGEAIENQTKVQNELLLSYVDVVRSHKYLNFLTPPPVLLPPMEIRKPNRFTITQLKSVIEQLTSLTQPSGVIDDNMLLAFFTQRTENSFGKDEFPEDWKSKSFKDYQKIAKNLDPDSKGYVQFKVLCSALCLLATPVPKEEDILEYQTVLSNNSDNLMIDRANFVNCNAFFDPYESSEKTEKNSKQFNRASLIKDILFDINKDEEKALVDVNEYIKTLTAVQSLYPKVDNKETLEAQSDGLTHSQLRESAVSLTKSFKKAKRPIIKTYTNVLFD